MSHPLEPIYALQKKDRKLIKLMREIRDIPQRKSDIEAQLSGSKKKLDMALDSRKHTEATLKEQELEVESLKEKVTKYKNQQMEAQTNEQYRAFVKEIGAVEDEIKALEEKEIKLMEDLESGKAIVAECEEKLSGEREGIADELEELDERAAYLQEKIEGMKADRMRAAAGCDKDLLQKYTRILNNKKDFAVVMVEPGGHCGGCHMKLPPQVTNDARNPAKIVACNFCGRIVYNPPERG
ncbi:C4-type zinc ribbon domain-containing protein [Pontiellaceae bacterium B12227]|nr:C4-type zinc ribbon domain-containing protein [Pontiellaceae bacterium B12227]